MLASIFICPQHGETWHVESIEIIDTINDEVYPVMVCSLCGNEVRPLIVEGAQACHALTDEEMFWELGASDDDQTET
jgi:hypothetical protein